MNYDVYVNVNQKQILTENPPAEKRRLAPYATADPHADEHGGDEPHQVTIGCPGRQRRTWAETTQCPTHAEHRAAADQWPVHIGAVGELKGRRQPGFGAF